MKEVVVYTDGSCLGNPGPGGFGAILCYFDTSGTLHEKIVQGGIAQTTNNRMELQAVISALGSLRHPCHVTIHTDSTYLRDGITRWIHNWKKNGWKTAAKKEVLNRDLWEDLDRLTQQHQLEWHWVKAHAGHDYNERCDAIAKSEAERHKGK